MFDIHANIVPWIDVAIVAAPKLIKIILFEISFSLHVSLLVCRFRASLEKFNDCSIWSLSRLDFTFSRQAAFCYFHSTCHWAEFYAEAVVGGVHNQLWALTVSFFSKV